MICQHNCLDYVDLRFSGADDNEGHLECMFRGCGATYSESELAAMSEDQQREPEARKAAA